MSLGVCRSRDWLLLAAVILLHLALVIPLAAALNLWVDEAYTLQSTGDGLAHAVRRAVNFELQPPFYFVLLTLWRSMNDSAFFARLFSILCTGSTIAVTASLARRYLPGIRPALAAAVVGLNPLTVFAAVEARFYALALLLSALLLLLFHDGYVSDKPSPVARLWYTLAAVVALYTFYFLGFLLVACGAALLVLQRRQAIRSYLISMVVVGALFAPLALTAMRQVGSVGSVGMGRQTPTEAGALVWQAAWRQLLPVSQENSLAAVRGWVSRLTLPLVMVAALLQHRRPTTAVLVPLIVGGIMSLFFVLVAMRLGSDFVRPQHTTVLYIPILLAMLALLQYVGRARAASVGCIASFVLAGAYVLQTYAPMAKLGDWIRVSHYIQRYESDSTPILVFKAEFVLALEYHYAGRNVLIPLPKPTGRERYDPKEEVLTDEAEILVALSERLDARRQFWLVTAHTQPFRGIDFHPEILEQFVERHCRVLRDESFVASRVRLLELLPEAGSPTTRIPTHGGQSELRQGRP